MEFPFYNTNNVISVMEQITLVFLIGAFILFMAQFKIKHALPVRVMGLVASVSTIMLSLVDPILAEQSAWLTIMIVTGFGLTLYNLLAIYKEL